MIKETHFTIHVIFLKKLDESIKINKVLNYLFFISFGG